MPSTSSPSDNGVTGNTGPLVIAATELDRLVQILRRQGRTVIGPVLGDGAIVNDVIEGADELPWGWTDEQGPGHYRLGRLPTREGFGFADPAQSFKRYLHPPRSVLFAASRSRDGEPSEVPVTITAAEPEAPPLALLGVRPCDLAALTRLDQALTLRPGVPATGVSTTRVPAAGNGDERADAAGAPGPLRSLDPFVVAVACNRPGGTCFCASMGTGPTPGPGHDLALTELIDGGPHEFLVEAATDAGRAVAAELLGRAAGAIDEGRAAALHERATEAMGRRLDVDTQIGAGRHLEHPRWAEVGDRCLACANCTLVCPTCFCSATEDITQFDPTARDGSGHERAERHLVWDSCFGSSFSELNGSPVRAATADRYRHWLLHKLVTWHDQFGTSGCVGCGRCITWCPVGIDLTEEAAALARPPAEAAA